MVMTMIGKRINDRYQILEQVGGGGMANVYKAHDVILNRNVAVKVLRPQFSDDDEFIRRFRREAQAATSMSHPNVVTIYDVGEENDLYYIVMEYVEGFTLKQLIQKRGVLPIKETVNIMLQISSAIAHAHANHIVHRDLKPHNILISEKGEAKVTDFGIARAMTQATITHTNSVMGSVHYLSPEQARGGMVNEKSDIYSLGIVLYEMVTGVVPFSGDTAVSIAIKHLQTEVPSPRRINPSLPQSIENIILRATAKDPFHRYHTVKEMEEDLHTALDPERFNEEKFVVPIDNDVTKAIPIIREENFIDEDLDKMKRLGPIGNSNDKTDSMNKKKKGKWLPIILLISILFIGVAVAAVTFIPDLLHVEEVTIPEDLVGLSYEDVVRELTDLELIVEPEYITDDAVAENHVVRYDPGAGEIVKVGSTITVFVSEGKEKIEMIDVTNYDKQMARRTLIGLGFRDKNIIERKEESDDHDENIVISQEPIAGSLISPEEAVVYLTYSVTPIMKLENLQGYKREEVLDYFKKNGLSGEFDDDYSDRFPEGEVMEQVPARNEIVRKGDVIKVTFSLGPKPEPDPEPISTFIEFEVPVSEEDQLAGLTYFVSITYNDSITQTHVKYTDQQPIQKTTPFKVPVTINPSEVAEVKVFINGEEFQTHTKPYEQVAKED